MADRLDLVYSERQLRKLLWEIWSPILTLIEISTRGTNIFGLCFRSILYIEAGHQHFGYLLTSIRIPLANTGLKFI